MRLEQPQTGWKPNMKRAFVCLCFAIACLMGSPARAVMPSFEEFFAGVSECRLDMTRFGALIDAYGEGAVIALPSAGALRGYLVDSFYIVPRRGQTPGQYGLLINAPLPAVRAAFPEFVDRATVNGHLRQLTKLSEHTRTGGAARKTLLVCTEGIRI
jgi:hypothetical protein